MESNHWFRDPDNVGQYALDWGLLVVIIVAVHLVMLQYLFGIDLKGSAYAHVSLNVLWIAYFIGVVVSVLDYFATEGHRKVAVKLREFYPDVFTKELLYEIEEYNREQGKPLNYRTVYGTEHILDTNHKRLFWKRCFDKHSSLVENLKLEPKGEAIKRAQNLANIRLARVYN